MDKSPMRITLVVGSLWGGGAERVASLLASGWAEQGHRISVLTFERGVQQSFPIHPSVKIHRLGLFHQSSHLMEGLFQNLRRVRILRRAIRESYSDVVISFGSASNVLTLLATRGLGVPVIIRETVDPLHNGIGRIWGGLRRRCYPLADVLVCPIPATVAKFQAIARVRGVAIANPVLPQALPARRQGQNGWAERHVLIAMGRLVRQKGFDLLLDAFSRLVPQHPDWSLTIIGTGPLRAELEQQSKALGLNGQIHFAGELTDPIPVLCAADLFVFSSRSETFGMALAEAMACGLPAVSFDCPEGPSDIIRHGIDGLLVPPEDVGALAAALDRLMSNSQERARLAARAPEVITRFGRERILSLWQELFNQLIDINPNCSSSQSSRTLNDA